MSAPSRTRNVPSFVSRIKSFTSSLPQHNFRGMVLVLYGLTSHSTHYRSFRGRFYRSDDPTNSVIALKDDSLPGQRPVPQASEVIHILHNAKMPFLTPKMTSLITVPLKPETVEALINVRVVSCRFYKNRRVHHTETSARQHETISEFCSRSPRHWYRLNSIVVG